MDKREGKYQVHERRMKERGFIQYTAFFRSHYIDKLKQRSFETKISMKELLDDMLEREFGDDI